MFGYFSCFVLVVGDDCREGVGCKGGIEIALELFCVHFVVFCVALGLFGVGCN